MEDPVTTDAGDLTAEAQQWIRDYGPAVESEWTTAGGVQATEDISTFEKAFVGRLIPVASRVVPGAVTAYEVCSTFIKAGCWLFRRDDSARATATGSWRPCRCPRLGRTAPTVRRPRGPFRCRR